MKPIKFSHMAKAFVLVASTLFALGARADFSNTVQSFHPVAYWPLNETTQPPSPASAAPAVNLGTLGSALNATFTGDDMDVIYGVPGALASTSDTADSFNGVTTRALPPYTSDLANAPSFTVEAWLLAHDDGSQFGTTCPLSNVDAISPRSGWLIYMNAANVGQYTFRTYNQNSTTASLSLDIGAAGSIQMEKWYHVVIVVSNAVTATNVYAFINGSLAAGPTVLPAFVPNDGANGSFTIGGRGDGDGFDFVGAVDEVAYYTNALDASTVLSHYQAGTNPSPVTAYATLVQQSHPILYYRLNEVPTALAGPYLVPLPVATNYGSLGALANGYYQPGTMPGIPGPTNAGFGSQSRACQFNRTTQTGINGPGVMCAPYHQTSLGLLNAMSLAAWVQVPAGTVDHFETVVGRSDESYRFDVDPTGNPHFAANPNGDVIGSVTVDDGLWHFWVGVFDPNGNTSYLYIDGSVVAQSPGSPLQEMTDYLFIGGAPDYSDRNFVGNICHLAIFTNALSSAQVEQLYTSVGAPPTASLPTNSITVDEGANASLAAIVNGSPPLSIQWYYINGSGQTNIASGQTSPTLSLSNVQVAQSGWQYFVVVGNALGVVTSSIATLTVISGPPQIQANLAPLSQQVPVGAQVTFCVSATGTEPFHYQWFINGSTPIAGATNSCYVFKALPGNNDYSVTVTGQVSPPATSSTATVTGLSSSTPPPVITFNSNGTGWTINTNANMLTAAINNNTLLLTDGTNSEASTAFFNTPQYVGGFVVFFTYNETNGTIPLADGATFCIQNSANGATALGDAGGGLGFSGIDNSAAFEINIYNGANGGRGIQFGTNGETPDSQNPTMPYIAPLPIALGNGHPINVRLYYNGSTMFARLVDAITSDSYSTAFIVGYLPTIVTSAQAYIGFTGATGGLNSIQSINNFRFSYTIPPIVSVTRNGANATLSWPVGVSTFFVPQQSPSLTGPWTNIGLSPTIVNGQNQVTVPAPAAVQFYRLVLQ